MKKVISIVAAILLLVCVSIPMFAADTQLATPQITQCESLDEGTKITWNPVEGAELYRVYYKGNSGWTNMGTTEETSFVDTSVSSGVTQVYTVRCINKEQNAFTSDFDRTGFKYTYNLKTPEITSISGTAEGVTITWNAVPNAVKYRVYYKGNGWVKMTETDQTSYLDTNVSLGGSYTYTVRCVNAAGNRFTSSFNSTGWKYTHYLDTPQITELKSVSNGVQITWGAVEGAEKYRVYYKGSNGWTKMTETDKTSYVNTKAALGDTYTYTVRCVNAAGSFTSSFNSTGWKHTRYLDTPQITSLKSVGKGIQITWDKVQGAEKYRVYYYGKSGWTKMGETTGTSFTHDSVDIGTTYRYTVRCINNSLTKFTSAHNSAGWTHTYNPQLDTPQITSINAGAKGTEISWNAVPGADLYRVYYKNITEHGSWTKLADVRTTSYIYNSPREGFAYTYTVRCLSSGAKGFASDFNHNGTEFILRDNPVIKTTQVKMDGIKLDVFALDCDTVRIYRKEGNGSWTRIGELDPFETEIFYDYDVVPGKTYTYTVRYIGENGNFISYFDTAGWKQKYVASECYPELEFFIYEGTNMALVQPKDDNKFGIKHFYLHTNVDGFYRGTFEITDEPVYIRADFFSVNRNYEFDVVGVDAKGNEITKTSNIWVKTLGSPTDFKADKIGDRQYRLSWKEGAGQPNGYYVSLLSMDGTIEVGSELIKGLSYDIDLSEYPEDTEWLFIVWATSKDEISNSWTTTLEFKEADYQ